MGLITETNAQYYSGQQTFPNLAGVSNPTFNCTFDIDVVSAFDSTGGMVSSASNYTIYINNVAQAENLSYVSNPSSNIITLRNGPYTGSTYIELKKPAIEENYGSYEYTSLNDVINNFIVAYVGEGKIIPRTRRSDVAYHAQRGLQELSYDTLRSEKSQEIELPPTLTMALPHDYVNYVKFCWTDSSGIERVIYPARKTSNPTGVIQDGSFNYIFDSSGNLQTASNSDTWTTFSATNASGSTSGTADDTDMDTSFIEGRRYGLTPEHAHVNGVFFIDNKSGYVHFSSDLSGKVIQIKYISDSLGTEDEMIVHKLAEEAMYKHIAHAILSTKANVQEYIIQRFKKERFAAIRTAKIRLSNFKSEEIRQVLRNKSKQIK